MALDAVMVVLRAKAASTVYFQGQVVMQVAAVRTSSPGAPILKGSVQTTTTNTSFEYNTGELNVLADTSGAMFVRFGVAYNFTAGQAQSQADVEIEVSGVQCGEVAGSGIWQLATTTVDDQFQAVTGFLPAILVAKVRAAAMCTSLSGNFRWRLAYRLAATSSEAPGAWAPLTDNNAPYVAGEVNTGDLAITVGSNMYVQLGILYDLSSAGTGQASIAIAIGVRRA